MGKQRNRTTVVVAAVASAALVVALAVGTPGRVPTPPATVDTPPRSRTTGT